MLKTKNKIFDYLKCKVAAIFSPSICQDFCSKLAISSNFLSYKPPRKVAIVDHECLH